MANNDLPSSSFPSSQGNYSTPSPNSSSMHLFNLNTMHQADVNTMSFDAQTAYTAAPACNTAAPNATATNSNDFLGLLSSAQLMAFDFNPAFPSVPFTPQTMPMTSTSTSSSMPTYEIIPPVVSNTNLLPLPADMNNLLMGLSEAQLQLCEHLFQLPGNHNNNNLTTHDGTTVFPDLNILHAGSDGGGIWPNVPQTAQGNMDQIQPTTANHGNQGFVMTNTLLPTSSIHSVEKQQRQQQHQQDMSCRLEPPAIEFYGTTTSSSRKTSELLVAPHDRTVLVPNVIQQMQQQQQQQPILTSQQQPILASSHQQSILASQLQPILSSQQYYPTTTSVNNNNTNNNNALVQPIVSSSFPNSSSVIDKYVLQQQQQQQQQLKQEMHNFYQNVHQQEQMRLQKQLQEQQQLQHHIGQQRLQERQLEQEQQQLTYSQGDATVSAPCALSSSVASQIPVSFTQPAFDNWTVNPHATITVPVLSTGPASPIDDLSSRNSSVGLSTPLANMALRSNPHQLRIQQQKSQLIDLNGKDAMTVDQQLLAAAIELKNLQYLDELRIHNQTLGQQSQQQQNGDGWVNQAQVQCQLTNQAQVQAQGASLQGSPKRDGTGSGDDSGDGSNGTDQTTLFQGAAHREELLNYRGYRYHGYGNIPGGAPQALQSNHTQTASSQAVQNDQGEFDYMSLSSVPPQQQPTASQNQLTASHGGPNTGTAQSSPAQAVQLQAPPATETSMANTLLENSNWQLAPLAFPPYPTTNINHYQMAAARDNNNNSSSGSSDNNKQQQYAVPPPPSSFRQDQVGSNNNNDNSSQQGTVVSLPSTTFTHSQKQGGSKNNSQQQPTQNTFPQEQEQQQDLYYGFSFEPQEGFEKKGDWPSLVTGAPLSEAAVPSLIQALHGTAKDGDNIGPHNVNYATAQLQLFADMTLSDAFSSGQYNNNLHTRNILTGGAGNIIECPMIQTGDEVVVVVKREKKSSLNCFYTEANEKRLKEQDPRPWKRLGRNGKYEVDPFFVQAATQVAQSARPVPVTVPIAVTAASTSTIVNNVSNNHDDDADSVLPPPPTLPARRGSHVSKKGAVQETSSSSSSSSPPVEPQVWICSIPHCNRQFASFGLLKSHKVSHDPHKPYWCEICSEDGITPRPISPTPIYPGIPVGNPEVKKYKRHHDLLRHKREQHPPLEVKIQRFKEKMEAKEARKLKAEETRREKAAAKRLANAAANAAVGRAATGRRRTSSAATSSTTASTSRSRRSSSTANATASDADHAYTPDVSVAPQIPRKRKSTETKRSSTYHDDDGGEEDDKDPDYKETELKRSRRSTTTLTAATTRGRRSSADQHQQEQQQRQQQATNSVSSSSSSVPGLVFIPLQAPAGDQHIYGPQLLQAQVQQAQQVQVQAQAQAQALQSPRRLSSTDQVKHEL